MNPTGCRRRQAFSYSGCESMSLAQLSSTARTRYRRSLKPSDYDNGTSAHIRHGLYYDMVPFHLLLATHDVVCVQEGDPTECVRRRPHPGQYAFHGAPSAFCGSSPPTRLGLKIADYWREPRHAPYGRLARPQKRTAN